MKKIILTQENLENTNGEGGVEIHIPGAIGNPTDTNNCPIFIEKYEGEIRVCIWNGEEDPTIIPIKMKEPQNIMGKWAKSKMDAGCKVEEES